MEKHINSLFSKLGLSEEPDIHRRVKAVLLYLADQDQGDSLPMKTGAPTLGGIGPAGDDPRHGAQRRVNGRRDG